jgi:hypothetical protein
MELQLVKLNEAKISDCIVNFCYQNKIPTVINSYIIIEGEIRKKESTLNIWFFDELEDAFVKNEDKDFALLVEIKKVISKEILEEGYFKISSHLEDEKKHKYNIVIEYISTPFLVNLWRSFSNAEKHVDWFLRKTSLDGTFSNLEQWIRITKTRTIPSGQYIVCNMKGEIGRAVIAATEDGPSIHSSIIDPQFYRENIELPFIVMSKLNNEKT